MFEIVLRFNIPIFLITFKYLHISGSYFDIKQTSIKIWIELTNFINK